jgi:hypothetical protein
VDVASGLNPLGATGARYSRPLPDLLSRQPVYEKLLFFQWHAIDICPSRLHDSPLDRSLEARLSQKPTLNNSWDGGHCQTDRQTLFFAFNLPIYPFRLTIMNSASAPATGLRKQQIIETF